VRLSVAYASRTLSVQERRALSIYELECLAVLFGFDKFRKYLEHQEFLLETDNQNVLVSCTSPPAGKNWPVDSHDFFI
jgi:hypothetical protein